MEEDKEILAISQVNAALKDLSEEERYRVIQWVANKYVQSTTPLKLAGPTVPGSSATVIEATAAVQDEQAKEVPLTHDTFAELLEAVGADAGTDLLIVAGYWLQVINGAAQWTTREANNVLKPTGFGIDRMDNLLPKVLSERPKRQLQRAKNKTAAGQGHRQLKLTDIGTNWVKDRLKGN